MAPPSASQATLKEAYAATKAAVARANDAYANVREELAERVRQREAGESERARASADKAEVARAVWEGLQQL